MIMRKFAFCFMILIVCQNIFAQLYVSNNYVYVADKYLYVKQDVNLQSAANIFLRNESQLLQGTSGLSTNQGIGELSVFQEGTSSNYGYNYWCSPVGNASASLGNGLFGITMFNRPTGVTTISSAPATILPNSNLNGVSTSTSLSIAQGWIFKFLSGTTYSQWIPVAGATSIAAGEGFTMKGVSGTDPTIVIGVQNNPGNNQRYDFRGKPNDGNINVSVIGTAGNMTLTGNPYPSAIDLNLFLTDATNTPFIDGTALFWEHNPAINSHYLAAYQGGYGVYNGTTSVYTPAVYYAYDAAGNQTGTASTPMNIYQRRFCPVGQGFMVRGTSAGTVQFKNTYRIFKNEGAANNSVFHRNASALITNYGFFEDIPNVAGTDYTQISKAPTPHININGALGNQAVRQISLCFMAGASDGVDLADSKSPDINSNLPIDMYLYLGDTEYINSTTGFEINKRYPLGFKNNATTTFKIQVADFVNFDAAENVYLYDSETNSYHDIKNSEYQLTLPAGVNNTRYQITFVNGALGLPELNSGSFDVVQNNTSQMLTIGNPNSVGLKSVALCDISGRLIFVKTDLGSKSNYQFSTSGISESVYIVKISTDNNGDFGKKIVVRHSDK